MKKNNILVFLLIGFGSLYAAEHVVDWGDSRLKDPLMGQNMHYDHEDPGVCFFSPPLKRENQKSKKDYFIHQLKKIFCPCLLPQKQTLDVSYASNETDGSELVAWGD